MTPVPAEHVLRSAPWRGLLAALDLHIANTRLSLDSEELARFCEEFEARQTRGPGISPREGRERRIQKLGVNPEWSRRIAAVEPDAEELGRELVEAVCGWTEYGRAHGKAYQRFHPGTAGLSQLESQVLDLAQRFLTETGSPDFVRICRYLSTDERPLTRQSALQALRRARGRLQRFLAEKGEDMISTCPFCGTPLTLQPAQPDVGRAEIQVPQTLTVRYRGHCDSCRLEFRWQQALQVAPGSSSEVAAAEPQARSAEREALARKREEWMGLRDRRAHLRTLMESLLREEASGQRAIGPHGHSAEYAGAQFELAMVEGQMQDMARLLRAAETRDARASSSRP